VGVES